jgi:hypothetical protein
MITYVKSSVLPRSVTVGEGEARKRTPKICAPLGDQENGDEFGMPHTHCHPASEMRMREESGHRIII